MIVPPPTVPASDCQRADIIRTGQVDAASNGGKMSLGTN